MKLRSILIAACLTTLGLAGCGTHSDQFVNIPAGFVGKVLTPNGWQKGVIEAGQVNLHGADADGRSSSLVLLEASAVQVKEQFMQNDSADHQDHRIITKSCDGNQPMPVAVDIYLRMRVPNDEQLRNRVFAEITPQTEQGDDANRVSRIKVQAVYDRFVHQEARSIDRKVIGAYCDDQKINADRAKIEDDLAVALKQRLQELRVPLELQSVSLSNVTPDPSVQNNRNQQAGAASQVAAIDQVGAALSRYPTYVQLEQVKAMQEAVKAGHPTTFVIGIDGPGAHAYAARAGQ